MASVKPEMAMSIVLQNKHSICNQCYERRGVLSVFVSHLSTGCGSWRAADRLFSISFTTKIRPIIMTHPNAYSISVSPKFVCSVTIPDREQLIKSLKPKIMELCLSVVIDTIVTCLKGKWWHSILDNNSRHNHGCAHPSDIEELHKPDRRPAVAVSMLLPSLPSFFSLLSSSFSLRPSRAMLNQHQHMINS